MKIADILEKAIQKEYSTYADAIADLNTLKLDYENQEKYEALLYKLLGKEERLVHSSNYFTGILNMNYGKILQETISLIRDGLYSWEITQHLYDKFLISPQLITYFINESLSIVRMNTLSPEEISSIGEAYHKVASNLEAKGIHTRPKIPENQEINAQDIMEIEEEFYEEEN